MRLQGRVAVVTGGSRGIGRAICERFAQEGASLVVAYRSSRSAAMEVAEATRAHGVEVALFEGDLTDPQAPGELVRTTIERFGQLDVLVNNAAVVTEQLLALLNDDELDAMLQTNVAALVRTCRAALRPMMRRRKGCIVNLSSVAARQPGRGNAVYAGTKGFVEAFTRALAVEVGRKGIRVNAVAPGVVETDMSAGVRALAGDQILAGTAMKRLGVPGDITSAVALLASDEASWTTGAIWRVDGGYFGAV